jgi:hypothetical protein
VAKLDLLEPMVAAALAKMDIVTPERIREIIFGMTSVELFSEVTEAEAESLARRFEERLGVTMQLGAVVSTEYRPWLPQARARIDPAFWDRYRMWLIQRGLSPDVLGSMDAVTDRILGLLEDPERQGGWDRRGMVVGHVQSGKTANYTGLVCKAADAGYKVIIVIAGIHNRLRNQTQVRLEEGFVGHSSSEPKPIGVGKFSPEKRPTMFTTRTADFNKTTASQMKVPLRNLKGPTLFVIKKNPSTLRNLVEWLQEHGQQHGFDKVTEPMLLIDDEADNASINIRKGKDAVSAINGLIRSLIGMFDRSCYIGYTATPFANIFIDPDERNDVSGEDLFPRDFIVSLDPPTNYVGPDRIFGGEERSARTIRHIDDNAAHLPIRHKRDHTISELPSSLGFAVRSFIIACAIRNVRGQMGEHASMLVNASTFTNVQRQLKNRIQYFLTDVKNAVRVNAALPPEDALLSPEIAELHKVWREEYEATEAWPVVLAHLHEAVAPVQVVEVNSRSSDSLEYENSGQDGSRTIAVGGYSLSRGLTLEGLTTTYFLRNSMMYDTLMQMGRWFGYREGYEDLCRIWMTEEAEGWYAHVAESVEMLRDELRHMESVGATPRQFGLKVQSHPDTLIVTARNKMGTGKVVRGQINLAKYLLETRVLRRDETSLNQNRDAVRLLAIEIEKNKGSLAATQTRPGEPLLIRSISVDAILGFLARYRNHDQISFLTIGDPVREYIQGRMEDELSTWDVFVPSVATARTLPATFGSATINCQYRTAGKRTYSDSDAIWIGNKFRVASRGAEQVGLSKAEIEAAENAYKGDTSNYPDSIYRTVRKRPLLILHLLRIDDANTKLPLIDEPVVAWSISFPPTARDQKQVEYVVNTVWMQTNLLDELDSEDDEDVD